MNRKIFGWALYDFANTPLTVATGGLFLAQWVVLDNHVDDIWYGVVFTLATIALLFTSPFLGAWSDKMGQRMPFMKWTTIILIVVGVLMGVVSVSSMERIPRLVIVLALFFVWQYVYHVSLIFYDALLKFLAKSEFRGKVSGIGEALGELGWLVGPLMLLPFSIGAITLFGEPGRGQVFLPAAAMLIVFGLPMFLWLKEPKTKNKVVINVGSVYKETIAGLRSLIKKNKNVTIFLVSFMFVSDALLTANLYFAIYLDQIFKMTDVQKGLFLVVMEVVAVVSALVFGRLSDRIGNKTLMIASCFNLTFVYVAMSAVSSVFWAFVLAGFSGFGFGVFYTTARTLAVKISPPHRLGEYLGFFSTFQRFASIIGPLTWGLVTFFLKDYGVMRYRVAVFVLAILMFLGTMIAFKIKEKPALVKS